MRIAAPKSKLLGFVLDALAVRVRRMFMRLFRVLVSFLGMVVTRRVITFTVMVSSSMMRLGSSLMVFSGVFVSLMSHLDSFRAGAAHLFRRMHAI